MQRGCRQDALSPRAESAERSGGTGGRLSEPEDLELEALQRQLDDAFDTTRPRAGFEDELWTRMQARRPAGSRLRDAWLVLIRSIREAPAVPMAAVAAVLVVVIGVSVLAYSGARFGGGAGSTASLSSGGQQYNAGAGAAPGAFGRLPSPVLSTGVPPKAADVSQPAAAAHGAEYAGPVTLTWTGKLDLSIATAPVFRYHEPSTNTADQFATSLGAILQNRPAGYLGSYETTDFNVRGSCTVKARAREPSFILLPITSVAPIEAAGGPVDVAVVFLAQHSLAPAWPYTPAVTVSGDQTKVTLLRQFPVAGYGDASLIDSSGERYGLEVALRGSTALTAAGPLAVNTE